MRLKAFNQDQLNRIFITNQSFVYFMCLAIPAKVIEIKGSNAKVDFGGTFRNVNISLVDAKENDYVLVHAGYAIQVMDEKEANETLKLWKEILGQDKETSNNSSSSRP